MLGTGSRRAWFVIRTTAMTRALAYCQLVFDVAIAIATSVRQLSTGTCVCLFALLRVCQARTLRRYESPVKQTVCPELNLWVAGVGNGSNGLCFRLTSSATASSLPNSPHVCHVRHPCPSVVLGPCPWQAWPATAHCLLESGMVAGHMPPPRRCMILRSVPAVAVVLDTTRRDAVETFVALPWGQSTRERRMEGVGSRRRQCCIVCYEDEIGWSVV